ncbi:hypothetical protein LguiB_008332 [Lonicera macranthoides]
MDFQYVCDRVQESSIASFYQFLVGIPLAFSYQKKRIPLAFDGLWVGCNAAFFIFTANAVIGVIVYSTDGVIVDGIGKRAFAFLAFTSEAIAVREACSLILSCCFSTSFIFSD